MERLITLFGCDWYVDYEWSNDRTAIIESISVAGNDVTDLLQEKVVEAIRQRINELWHEDQSDLASMSMLMRRAA